MDLLASRPRGTGWEARPDPEVGTIPGAIPRVIAGLGNDRPWVRFSLR